MKQKSAIIVLFIIGVLVALMVSTLFQQPLSADEASCEDGTCICTCKGTGCGCETSTNYCRCFCNDGESTCGKQKPSNAMKTEKGF